MTPGSAAASMSKRARSVRYSAAQAKQMIFDALDNDSYSSNSDSGTDYDDHVSQPSEQSDKESVDASCPSADSTVIAPVRCPQASQPSFTKWK